MAEHIAVKFITAFVLVLLGTVLVGVIATQALANTSLTVQGNEKHFITNTSKNDNNLTFLNESTIYKVTNYPTDWKPAQCPLSDFVLTNKTGAVLAEGASNGYVLNAAAGTYYLRNTAGSLALAMGSGSDNATYATYKFCPDAYVTNSFGRTALLLIPGFFALALMLAGVALFYSVGKETGII